MAKFMLHNRELFQAAGWEGKARILKEIQTDKRRQWCFSLTGVKDVFSQPTSMMFFLNRGKNGRTLRSCKFYVVQS